jgi:uncharacterized membrane protein YfcA
MTETVLTYLPFIAGLALTGAFAGLTAGLLGVGGGVVTVPALSYVLTLLGYDQSIVMHVAVATSLAVIIPTGWRSALAHNARGAVDHKVLRLWGPPIVIASLAGGLMAGWFSSDVLRIIFGGTALLIALNIVMPAQQALMGRLSASPLAHRISAGVIGYISSLMGIGGGSLSVPTLTAFGSTIHAAVGTSSALGVMLAIPGMIGFIVSGWFAPGTPPFSLGFVNLPAFVLIGIIASLISPLGAALAHRLPGRGLKLLFAAYLVIIGGRMLWTTVFG